MVNGYFTGVEEGPFGVLPWLIGFWNEVLIVEFWVLHVLVNIWVGSVLLEEWITEVFALYW